MPALRADRTLSAWEVDSGRVFLASLRDAEEVATKYANENDDLVDPPEQMGEPAPLLEELKKASASGSEYKPGACRKTGPSMSKQHRARQAPSIVNHNRDANTVEVVKHMGRYEVIIDGVSQGIIEKENGVYKDAYTFWMPRFKETKVEVSNGDDVSYKRVVQPVLFGMRVEDFESVPSRCVVESTQRVIHDGRVYMDDTKLKTSEITPYQVNSDSANVTVLPYPLVCTPAPYVTINDYSTALRSELALKLHWANATPMENLTSAYKMLFSNPRAAVKEVWGFTSKTIKFTGKYFFGNWLIGALQATVTYMLYSFIKRGLSPRLSDEELLSTKAMLAAALNRGPVINRVTLPELTQMIYRIAETREDGSVANTDNTLNTLGEKVLNFEKLQWKAEAAMLRWIMYGSGPRGERDEYTGLYKETSTVSHVASYGSPQMALDAPPTLNTIGVQGLHPLALANSRTEFSYTVRIQESDGTPGPVIVLDATRINGLDAGWIAAGYEEQFAECRRSLDCLRSKLATLPSVRMHIISQIKSLVNMSEPADLDDRTQKALFRDNRFSLKELTKQLGRLEEEILGDEPYRLDGRQADDVEGSGSGGGDGGGDGGGEGDGDGGGGEGGGGIEEYNKKYDDDMDRFWTNEFYKYGQSRVEPLVISHFQNTARWLALSLGVQVADLKLLSHRHIRFMEILSPARQASDSKLMRFAAFLVPRPIKSVCVDPARITRLMPQVLFFSRELVSTFGVLTILQPISITDKTFISEEDASLASKSIAQARVALRNMTSVFPQLIKEVSVYGNTCTHFYQNYIMAVSSEREVSKLLSLEVKEETMGADFFATAYLPSLESIDGISKATEAGGSLLADMKRVASGKNVQGAARTLDSFGLSRDVHSYLALALFAEILTYHILEHGHSSRNAAGFQLERIELVQSALSTAKYSTRAIGSFLSETYGSKTGASRTLHENDIAFYCIPGLLHLRVALKRLGVFSEEAKNVSKFACLQTGRSLVKLGSAPETDLQKLPFTCVQSAAVNIPLSVRMLNGNTSSVELHIASSSLSYERVYLIASRCMDARHAPAIAYVCADVVFTRPISIKAYAESPVVSSAVSARVSNLRAQEGWSRPTTLPWSVQMLRARLARLRLDIFAEQKHAVAATQASVDGGAGAVDLLLVNQMNNLDVRGLSTRSEKSMVANYFIPFGFIDRGTLGDLFHSEFEQQPVWMELLMDAAISLLAVDAAAVANTYVVSSEANENGQPHNPHVISITDTFTDTYARLQLYPTKSASSVPRDPAALILQASTASMSQMCIKINESGLGHQVSGRLCEHYRLCMHDAERLFQAALALGARAHRSCPLEPVRIGLRVNNIQEFHMPTFVASACVANALASALVGSASRVVVEDMGRGERVACQAIEAACKDMLLRGIKAVPFCELCVALSLL